MATRFALVLALSFASAPCLTVGLLGVYGAGYAERHRSRPVAASTATITSSSLRRANT
jgi:hypothetical protein